MVKFCSREGQMVKLKYLKGPSKLCFCPCIVKNLLALNLPNGNNLLNNLRNLQPYLFMHKGPTARRAVNTQV